MTDEETLCSFVIWRLRAKDLPADVAAAADRLLDRFPRPGPNVGYLEADFSVSGVNRQEEPLVTPWLKCFGRHDALDAADRLVNDGWDIVLVERSSRS